MPSRRDVLLAAVSLAAAAQARGQSAAGDRPALPIPPLRDARAERGLRFAVQSGESRLIDGVASPTLGYDGAYLGPTLRVRRGDEVAVEITNRLHEDTTVHWHGLLVPGDLDGGPHQTIAPGAAWRPRLPIQQPAATLLYHSHVHDRTAEQVYFGLAGVLIITDDIEPQLGLPSEYGVDDLPLVLQDRAFDRDGRLAYVQSMPVLMHGMRGPVMLVNGAAQPVAAVPPKLVRLRLVNGANARLFRLSFSDQRRFWWIASDSGLLAAPVERSAIDLGPGERAELLVDFAQGGAVDLLTAPDPNAPMMGRMMGGGMARAATVMRFEPAAGSGGRSARVPPRLVADPAADQAPDATQATRRRRLVLTMGMGGMGMGGMGGGMGGDMRAGPGGGHGVHGIDGRPFDMNRIDQEVRLGDTEIWEVAGEMMAHPFHMHGVRFKVLRRGGRAPGPEDQGWKDTVMVDDPVELLVQFTQPTRGAPFMYHCHILEHEDNGMMGQFTVT